MPSRLEFPNRLPEEPLFLDEPRALEIIKAWSAQKSFAPGLPDPDLSDPNSQAEAFMKGVQGNIIRPHGRRHVRLLFFEYDGSGEEFCAYLAKARSHISSAFQQWVDAKIAKFPPKDRHRPFATLSLTREGVQLVEKGKPGRRVLHQSWSNLPRFRKGMWEERSDLGDTLDGSDWEDPLYDPTQTPLHGMWLLARESVTESCPGAENGLENLEAKILQQAGPKLIVRRRENGMVLRDQNNDAREPFGFRDGISMPTFFKQTSVSGGLKNLPLSNVMFDRPGNHLGGSFMVYRKLRQDVEGFSDFEQNLKTQLRNRGMDEVDPGRLLIGRYRDGQPLTGPLATHNDVGDASMNAFDFASDQAGSRCPFHAHIRKSNPRPGGAVQANSPSVRTQFVRRSAVYGWPSADWKPGQSPAGETGLLFMAHMSDIGQQFFNMQCNLYSSLTFPGKTGNAPEPLTWANYLIKGWSWKAGMDQARIAPPDFRRFVLPKGGMYLLTPSFAWLGNPGG
ncbi:MAG: Dyp-type peroxidase [Synoicihabitans sp.]